MRTPSSHKKLADLIMRSCGYGKLLEVGSGSDSLVPILVEHGIDAYAIDTTDIIIDQLNNIAPERCSKGSILGIPYPDEYFETATSIDGLFDLAEADVKAAICEISRVSSRYVFLRIVCREGPTTSILTNSIDRSWWENICFKAGLRKHPLYYQINHYESLNDDRAEVLIALEKVPRTALQHYDLTVLLEERVLHTDMLRETGRRSDAHCIRYQRASEYIRRGDLVLDVACGLGYGSHILFSSSKARAVIGVDISNFSVDYANAHYYRPDAVQFKIGDAQNLKEIADNSIDFITAFETIEHVPDPDAYLVELKRVLKPSGRLMISAPNNWVDETGKDPNPHHLHIYTWSRLIDECAKYFLLEKGFLQTAGGAMRYHHSPRSWIEVQPEKEAERDGEWVLLLCMADPVIGKSIPYKETAWALPSSSDFNISAFERDYENPWLVRGMIAIGMRVQSEALLEQLQQRVFEVADEVTVDYGSALCGQIYSFIRQHNFCPVRTQQLEDAALSYASITEPKPHQRRWQVSLLYAIGELARSQGRADHARDFYSRCAAIDVMPYSPLLGNKTIDSLFRLSIYAVANGDIESARQHLQKSVVEAQRLVSASWLNIIGEVKKPLPFGFAEASQLMDKAARAAYALDMLKESDAKPGLFYSESTGFFERQIAAGAARVENLENALHELVQLFQDGEASRQILAGQIAISETRAQDLARQVIESELHAQDLANQVIQSEARAQDLASQVIQTEARAQELASQVIQSEARAQELASQVIQTEARAQDLANQVIQSEARARDLVSQVIQSEAHAQE